MKISLCEVALNDCYAALMIIAYSWDLTTPTDRGRWRPVRMTSHVCITHNRACDPSLHYYNRLHDFYAECLRMHILEV